MNEVIYQVYPEQDGYMLYECTLERGMRPRQHFKGEGAQERAEAERRKLNNIERLPWHIWYRGWYDRETGLPLPEDQRK